MSSSQDGGRGGSLLEGEEDDGRSDVPTRSQTPPQCEPLHVQALPSCHTYLKAGRCEQEACRHQERAPSRGGDQLGGAVSW